MRPIVHKAKNFDDAERWDIVQQINMTAEDRQRIAKELKRKILRTKLLSVKRIKNLK